eukprot:3689435-Pyramimonas_sp.AAC.2
MGALRVHCKQCVNSLDANNLNTGKQGWANMYAVLERKTLFSVRIPLANYRLQQQLVRSTPKALACPVV